jgi:hypothetical protein
VTATTKDGAKAMPVVSIPQERIAILDEEFQIREGLKENTVRKYQRHYQVGTAMPPVRIAQIGKSLYLIDGFHRLEAQRRNGAEEVAATIEPIETREEAAWLGGKVNSEHGLPLNKRERHRLFRLYLSQERYYLNGQPKTPRSMKSYRAIGREFGITDKTARALILKYHPKLCKVMDARNAGKYDLPKGGLRPPAATLLPEDLAERSLNNARAIYVGIETPEARGRVIAKAEEVTAEMKQGGQWMPKPTLSASEEF